MLYQFTGDTDEVFPSIVTADGSLTCTPGQVIDLDVEVSHPRLVPVKKAAKDVEVTAGAVVVDGDPVVDLPAPVITTSEELS